ncbi:hypothetical protein C453_14246 [Haloferax elongans ATCC BAA-1513]|uniref:Uncharacterized protein n=1 Tax=Haloferax elongans ATCC BAA-1513 TaxID=1230453 RepID=M0HHA2_HALEO|nr:hypothetical protein [Haloferax elongans]ELZ83173.1 hypothetical protein C453_14246 [Haloferax elongans ATCC BAA-1513]
MKRSTLVVLAVLALVGGGVATAFVTGVGPFASDDDELDGEFPTQTATPSSGGDSSGGGDGGDSSGGDSDESSSDETSTPPFTFVIEDIEECGQTCRDVTSSVTNQQDDAATGVTVYSRIYVGNSTAEDDVVWQGKEEIGGLESGESYTATRRVELSFTEAFAVQQADGWITIQTTIQSDEQTLTYTERRDVV